MISNFLNEGKVGKIATDAQAQVRKQINERWENLGFTKGLKGYLKENMAVLFENQANQTLKSLNEATDSTNSGSFETVVFPLVRRVFSRLLANDIVSVQAMNMPIGRLFFIKPVTSERKWEVTDTTMPTDGDTGSHYGLMGYERVERNSGGTTTNRYYLPDEVVEGNPAVTQYMKKSLYDLFYNDFLYDNSKGKVHIKVGEIEAAEIGVNGKPTAYPVSSMDDTLRNAVISVKGFSNYNASKLTGPDGNEMDTETFLASLKVVAKEDILSGTVNSAATRAIKKGESIPFRVVTQRYGHGIVEYSAIADKQGKIYLELDLARPTKNAS